MTDIELSNFISFQALSLHTFSGELLDKLEMFRPHDYKNKKTIISISQRVRLIEETLNSLKNLLLKESEDEKHGDN